MVNKRNKSVELDGRMTAEGTDIKSTQYHEALGVLFNRTQERTPAEQLLIKMTALRVKMKNYLEDSSVKKKELQEVQYFYWEMLNTANVSQNKLAAYIGYQPTNLSVMFKDGKVNYEIAKILESIFKINSTLWLDIQAKNRGIVSTKKQLKSYDDYSYEGLVG